MPVLHGEPHLRSDPPCATIFSWCYTMTFSTYMWRPHRSSVTQGIHQHAGSGRGQGRGAGGGRAGLGGHSAPGLGAAVTAGDHWAGSTADMTTLLWHPARRFPESIRTTLWAATEVHDRGGWHGRGLFCCTRATQRWAPHTQRWAPPHTQVGPPPTHTGGGTPLTHSWTPPTHTHRWGYPPHTQVDPPPTHTQRWGYPPHTQLDPPPHTHPQVGSYTPSHTSFPYWGTYLALCK